MTGRICKRREHRRFVSLSVNLLTLSLMAALASAAHAACTPTADNTPSPAPGTTVTCSGNTVQQNGNDGYGTGTQSGITVNVDPGASVTTPQSNGIGVNIAGGTVVNGLAGTIQGAYGIQFYSGTGNVTNSGSVSSTSYFGIFAQGAATIDNTATGTITGAFQGIQSAGSINLTNSGTITSGDVTIYSSGGPINVTNYGQIRTTSGLAPVIYADAGDITVINGGSITNNNSFSGVGAIHAAAGNGTVTNLAGGTIATLVGHQAVFFSGTADITNSGEIRSLRDAITGNSGVTLVNNAGGVVTGGFTAVSSSAISNITNSGTIAGTTFDGIAGAGVAVTNNAGGLISGGRYAIISSSGGATVFNAGTIAGGTAAIQFSGSGNTLTLAQGFTITGAVVGTGADTLQLGGAAAASFDMTSVGAAAQYRGFGNFNKIGTSTWTLTGASSFSGATNVTGGTLRAGSAGALSASSAFLVSATLDLNGFNNSAGSLRGSGIVTNNGAVAAVLSVGGDNTSRTFSGSLQDGSAALGFAKTGTGTLTLSGINTYSGGTTLNASTILVRNNNVFGSGLLAVDGATLQGNVGSLYNLSNAVALGAGGVVLDARAGILGLSGNIADGAVPGGALRITDTTIQHGGTVILAGNNSYTGSTTIDAGANALAGSTTAFSAASDFVVNGGLVLAGRSNTIRSLSGNGEISDALGAPATLTIAPSGGSSTFSGQLINGPAGLLSLTKAGAGTQILEGINSYTGATTINGGRLSVNGSIASSSLTTVNAGGTLGGNGVVGETLINGGTLAPGNSIGLLTVQGNLVLTSAARYMVEVSPANADRVNVTGTATLGGATVNASFAPGSYVTRQYTIVNAAGGVTGTFGSQVNTDLPSNFTSSLSYDANNAYLNLKLNYMPPAGLNRNQQAVGNALVGYFNRTGGIPLAFGALAPAGLTAASGETATGSQQATFDAMNLFMGVMTDPFVDGRGSPIAAAGTNGFADDAPAYAAKRRPYDALAAIYRKAPPVVAEPLQRWSIWAAGYGGSQTTDGNAITGSSNATSRIYGMAVGADYRISPHTLAGFALAGGGTSFNVNGQGSGRSDLFQAGAFLRHTVGASYLTAAIAYGWQDITTDRTVTAAGIEQLRAQFNANAFSGRIEAGHRFVAPVMGGVGLTPYAAGQLTRFNLPTYAESAVAGTGTFALNYSAKTASTSRSELGLRSDKSFALTDAILTLRGRAAWAHDFNPDRSIGATFQALPGATFVVNGAAPGRNAALTTASAEIKWPNGISLAASFEGEFSDVTRSYAGKGVAKYQW